VAETQHHNNNNNTTRTTKKSLFFFFFHNTSFLLANNVRPQDEFYIQISYIRERSNTSRIHQQQLFLQSAKPEKANWMRDKCQISITSQISRAVAAVEAAVEQAVAIKQAAADKRIAF
jgi:hypothetical protein